MSVQSYEIVHEGMGWPVGARVAPGAFRHNPPLAHLHIGAVKPCEHPPTHGCDLPAKPAGHEEAEKQNEALRVRVSELEAKLAGQTDLAAKLSAELDAARKELAEAHALLEQATAVAQIKDAQAVQARLDAGPRAA